MDSNFFEILKKLKPVDFAEELSAWNIHDSSIYNSMSSRGYVFKQYESLSSLYDQYDDLYQKYLQGTSLKEYERDAIGFFQNTGSSSDKTFFIDWINEESPDFSQIRNVLTSVTENVKDLVNIGGAFKKRRLMATMDENAMFDFSLASQGLYRPVEFFSRGLEDDITKGKINNPFAYLSFISGVIPSEKITRTVLNDTSYFYFSFKSKKYTCERRQRGATAVFKNFSNECMIKPNSDGLFLTYNILDPSKVFNGKGKHKLKYASRNKKSYLKYEKTEAPSRYVDLFQPINYLTGKQQTANIFMPVFLIAEVLEKYGIKTRISALRMGSDSNTSITVAIPIKDYKEDMKESFNRLFNVFGKKSVVRTVMAFGKVLAENEGVQATPTYNTDASFNKIAYTQRQYCIEQFSRYKNWVRENKDKPWVNTKTTSENFQFIVPQQSLKGTSTMRNTIEHFPKIIFQFYYYLDFMAFEMISLSELVKQVVKRFQEDEVFQKVFTVPSNKNQRKNIIRQYLLTILFEKYQKVVKGAYKDSAEQISAKDELIAAKSYEINQALNSM